MKRALLPLSVAGILIAAPAVAQQQPSGSAWWDGIFSALNGGQGQRPDQAAGEWGPVETIDRFAPAFADSPITSQAAAVLRGELERVNRLARASGEFRRCGDRLVEEMSDQCLDAVARQQVVEIKAMLGAIENAEAFLDQVGDEVDARVAR